MFEIRSDSSVILKLGSGLEFPCLKIFVATPGKVADIYIASYIWVPTETSIPNSLIASYHDLSSRWQPTHRLYKRYEAAIRYRGVVLSCLSESVAAVMMPSATGSRDDDQSRMLGCLNRARILNNHIETSSCPILEALN